ncbi:small acid-soluble spore protein Tlp [Oceanirhabdus sp. W0125-5]|uniref:small acid-soluble spore protein Tlp n=1 Tax=Oceanirhabdus sp. W0125-5 TaxID=2999116 RepID=UPI0022F2E4D1|nr:small acid-soluble spore protein Tlp [Oceanirhabdus sp. W0125-5]WBW95620.1 small acid-soluble spore protein Tlp [Oceanirhabdus sp. W0125-5]
MKNNKDNISNDVNSIQYKVEKTLENYHETEELINRTDDEEMKSALEAKNARRVETLKNIKKDVKKEVTSKHNEFQ